MRGADGVLEVAEDDDVNGVFGVAEDDGCSGLGEEDCISGFLVVPFLLISEAT